MLLRHTLSGAQISATLVGIGLNLNQKQFVGDAPNPVSLRQIIGRSVDREQVLTDVRSGLDRAVAAPRAGPSSESSSAETDSSRAARLPTIRS